MVPEASPHMGMRVRSAPRLPGASATKRTFGRRLPFKAESTGVRSTRRGQAVQPEASRKSASTRTRASIAGEHGIRHRSLPQRLNVTVRPYDIR